MASVVCAANKAPGMGLLAMLLFALPAPAADSPPAVFNNHCRTCHSVKQGDHRLGPSLHGVYGSEAGSSPGYTNYSQSMKSSGITWDEDTLDRFIEDPEQVVRNNNMKPYKGVPDAAVRKQIVDFLKSQQKSQQKSQSAARARAASPAE